VFRIAWEHSSGGRRETDKAYMAPWWKTTIKRSTRSPKRQITDPKFKGAVVKGKAALAAHISMANSSNGKI
jgi:hypothetical protein